MLIDFFHHLKAKPSCRCRPRVPHAAGSAAEARRRPRIDDFYFLSRACLVKDETNYDKFDRAFGEYFKGIERRSPVSTPTSPKSG
jgi:uncharacterized protein with von Willebrand factor type A (vWA) domain